MCNPYAKNCVSFEKNRNMDIMEFREYCLSLPMVEETTPFDEDTLVYKIGGKIFACGNMTHFDEIAVKCDPAEVETLRDSFPDITAPRYFNKKHWNSVHVNGDLPLETVQELIRKSYWLVLRKSVTPKSLRDELVAMVQKCGLSE